MGKFRDRGDVRCKLFVLRCTKLTSNRTEENFAREDNKIPTKYQQVRMAKTEGNIYITNDDTEYVIHIAVKTLP